MRVIHYVRWVEYVNASSTVDLIIRHLKRELGMKSCKSVVLERCTSRQVV